MVSLDDAVVARLEKGGKRYEVLVDPELVEQFKAEPESVELDNLLATDEIWHDARGGERPTEEKIMSTFGTSDLRDCVMTILLKGDIQLTTTQRRQMIADKRQQIITEISRTAIDPRSKAPHPITRIELALDELRWNLVDGLRDGTVPLNDKELNDHLRQTVVNQVAIDQPRYSGFNIALAGSYDD